jgi:hypothetical protein
MKNIISKNRIRPIKTIIGMKRVIPKIINRGEIFKDQ